MSGKFKLVCLFILYALMLHLSQPQMVCTQHPCGCEAPMPPAGTRLKTGRRPGEKAIIYNYSLTSPKHFNIIYENPSCHVTHHISLKPCRGEKADICKVFFIYISTILTIVN